MIKSRLEEHAKRFAITWHGDQKYGDKPYIVHLEAVREVLLQFGVAYESPLGIAAWLHDVLEDTEAPPWDIEYAFSSYVLSLVEAVTGRGANRRERVKNKLEKIAAYAPAAPLALADRIVNVEKSKAHRLDLFEMYRREQIAFEHALLAHIHIEPNVSMLKRLQGAFL